MQILNINKYLLCIYAGSVLKVFKHFKSQFFLSLSVGLWCFNVS